jgi:prephenate dehydrogenase
VLGLGLIGGSVLRAVTASGATAWGATASPVDGVSATGDGYTVEPTVLAAVTRAADEDALVVIAVPLPAVDDVLRVIADAAPRCRLTDVVSVQGPVADAVRRLAPEATYVGGHPMAGASASGWTAGSAELMRGAAWVVETEDDTPLAHWREVAELAFACGAHVVPASADEHDSAVARISHLPHVMAEVLASVGADGGPLALALAAGSFQDGTRVAGSRPELVKAMCEGNRAGLLTAVDEALGRLGAARGALASTGSLGATIKTGHEGRQALEALREAERERTEIDLDTPGVIERLREVGRTGGRIVALAGNVALAEVPAL